MNLLFEAIKGVTQGLFDKSHYFLFILVTSVILSSIFPSTFCQGTAAVAGVTPLFIRDYFSSVQITADQLFSVYHILSVITILSFFLLLIQLRIGKISYHIQNIFENSLLLCTYFLLLNMILSNLNMPTAELIASMQANSDFFFLMFPFLTIAMVLLFAIHIVLTTILLVIDPHRFEK
jgi:small-conductance mechanosensitive channel